MIPLTSSRSRQPSAFLGLPGRNMLFRPFNESLPDGFFPDPSPTETVPDRGPAEANQHLHES